MPASFTTTRPRFCSPNSSASPRSSPPPVRRFVRSPKGLEETTVEAIEGVRRMAVELRPPALDDLGLLAALGDLAQRFMDQRGIEVDYQARGSRGRLPAEVELVLYRVAQEAMTNIAKHAGASRVWIDLDRDADDVTPLGSRQRPRDLIPRSHGKATNAGLASACSAWKSGSASSAAPSASGRARVAAPRSLPLSRCPLTAPDAPIPRRICAHRRANNRPKDTTE